MAGAKHMPRSCLFMNLQHKVITLCCKSGEMPQQLIKAKEYRVLYL